MRFLIRVLLLFFVVTSLLSVIRRAFVPAAAANRARRPGAPGRPRPDASSGHLVKDPVCGMYIPESDSLRVENAFFCSEDCRKKYLQSR